jgi:signal transduction histidine kinase
LERPFRRLTLLSTLEVALRSRRRQYQVRDLLEEREQAQKELREHATTLEQKVDERTAELNEKVAELESFSYSVSHDLRAPLRVMAGYAQVILDDFNGTLVPEVRNFVERIARSADRMDRLTQDVLAYTRLSRAEIPLEPIDLEIMVREIIEQYPTLAASGSSISIRRPLAGVMAHGPSLAQALSNLIENALKFARPDVAPKFEVATKIRGDRVRILVKDNGIGIEPAHQRKIFRIFERVADHQVPGTGIGLAIVKKAAERMFGTVGVVSRKKTGSEFWIELARVPRQRLARGEENAAGGGS